MVEEMGKNEKTLTSIVSVLHKKSECIIRGWEMSRMPNGLVRDMRNRVRVKARTQWLYIISALDALSRLGPDE
ncbi:MAG: hypothetical protein NPIRA04_11300 [Nitrospirales bacterium]|nr:MAG: hypothetical protein NPIRA04_11300 [Nitrospirales bacterium]